MILLKLTKTPPPPENTFTLFPSPDFQERGKGGIRRGGLWLILTLQISRGSLQVWSRKFDVSLLKLNVPCVSFFSWTIIINWKSKHFFVIKGYFCKCLITASKSFNDITVNWRVLDPCFQLKLPTCKNFLISSKTGWSFLWGYLY